MARHGVCCLPFQCLSLLPFVFYLLLAQSFCFVFELSSEQPGRKRLRQERVRRGRWRQGPSPQTVLCSGQQIQPTILCSDPSLGEQAAAACSAVEACEGGVRGAALHRPTDARRTALHPVPYRVARESLIFTEAFSSEPLSCGYRLLEMATCHSLEELGILRPAAEDLGKTDLYFKEMRLLLEASSGLGKAFTLLKPSEGCGVIEAFAQTQGIYAIQVSVVSLA